MYIKSTKTDCVDDIVGSIITVDCYVANIVNGFYDLEPPCQRDNPAWDQKTAIEFWGTNLKKIGVLGKPLPTPLPSIVMAKNHKDIMQPGKEHVKMICLDGANRSRQLKHFIHVEPVKYGNKRTFPPCYSYKENEKTKYIFFKHTPYVDEFKKNSGIPKDDTTTVRVLSEKEQNDFLSISIHITCPQEELTWDEMTEIFLYHQNGKHISKISSNYLKNLTTVPFIRFMRDEKISIYQVTADIINSDKYHTHISTLFYIVMKMVMEKNDITDIYKVISEDDKSVVSKIQRNDSCLEYNEEYFNQFKSVIQTYDALLRRSIPEGKKISILLFKSMFLYLIRRCPKKIGKREEDLEKNMSRLIHHDSSMDLRRYWYGKSNKDKVRYDHSDIEDMIANTYSIIVKTIENEEHITPVLKRFVQAPCARAKKIGFDRKTKTEIMNRDFEENTSIECLCCHDKRITRRTAQAGHIIAESEGGESIISNGIAICDRCNGNTYLGMGTRNLFEFQEEVYPNADSAREYMESFDY
jgi:5-methylcytosine-specific restriction endonuclease McrA